MDTQVLRVYPCEQMYKQYQGFFVLCLCTTLKYFALQVPPISLALNLAETNPDQQSPPTREYELLLEVAQR